MNLSRFYVFVLGFLLLASVRASASHVYGADFYYTFVSGTTYTITMDIYGDCGGGSFSTLTAATPEVQIKNGTTVVATVYLSLTGTPTDVTPVCPAQSGNTRCATTSTTLPGVKKYTYTANYTLGSASANWVFKFTGDHVNSTAGRSGAITNIFSLSTTVLEAALNNVPGPNSSVIHTTIPTPFYCINKPAQFNPGAVDPNLDSLSYALVTGLSRPGTVSYLTG